MEYEIVDVKKGNVWSSGYGEMQSYTISLKGISEPVVLNKKVPVKQEPHVGELLYGTLEEKTNQKGNVYMKFSAEKRPESTGQAQGSNWHESPEKQESVNRAVALKAACVIYQGTSMEVPHETITGLADSFYSWLTQEAPATAPAAEVIGDEPIDLDSIPF